MELVLEVAIGAREVIAQRRRQVVLLAERQRKIVEAKGAELDEAGAKSTAPYHLRAQCLLELLLGDESRRYQHLADAHLAHCIAALFVARKLDKEKAGEDRRGPVERMGLLAAAGFITGEALMGIGLAVPVGLKHDENAIALFLNSEGCPKEHPNCHAEYADFAAPSLLFVGIVLILLYILSLKPEKAPRAK